MTQAIEIKKTQEVTIQVTPSELGEIFAHMDNVQQAEFLNSCAAAMEAFDGPYEFQLAMIETAPNLNDSARELMRQFGEYNKPVLK